MFSVGRNKQNISLENFNKIKRYQLFKILVCQYLQSLMDFTGIWNQ